MQEIPSLICAIWWIMAFLSLEYLFNENKRHEAKQ